MDADMVCFIHRPEYYKIYTDDRGNDLRGMAEIIIAKHRNGAVGDVLLRFRGEYARFQNPDDDLIVPMPGEEPRLSARLSARGVHRLPFRRLLCLRKWLLWIILSEVLCRRDRCLSDKKALKVNG